MLYGFQHRNFRVVVTARCFKPLQLEVCRAFLEKWWRFLQEREVCRTVPRLSWRMKLVHLICAIFLIVKAKNPISVAYVYFGRNRFFGRWRKALTRLDEVNAKFVAQSKMWRFAVSNTACVIFVLLDKTNGNYSAGVSRGIFWRLVKSTMRCNACTIAGLVIVLLVVTEIFWLGHALPCLTTDEPLPRVLPTQKSGFDTSSFPSSDKLPSSNLVIRPLRASRVLDLQPALAPHVLKLQLLDSLVSTSPGSPSRLNRTRFRQPVVAAPAPSPRTRGHHHHSHRG